MENKIFSCLEEMREIFISDLCEIVKIPSVASEDVESVHKCAKWLESFFEQIGITPIVDYSANQPVILAEVKGETDTSILFYGHYDVVPANPDEWSYPPFGATIEDGKIFGRGTVDDKAQILAPLEAVRAFLQCGRKPPVTVKFLFEGEEELGSPSLGTILDKYHNFLYCDALVNYDDCVWYDGRPRVVCGLKGGVSFSLTTRMNREFHGMMHSIIPGAIWRLLWAINSLMDQNGNILIENFFDDVIEPTEQELKAAADLNWDSRGLLIEAGIKEFIGGKSTTEAVNAFIFNTAIGISGISGGYVYPERKGVVPAYATADVHISLVPNQTAEKVIRKVESHLQKNGFDDVEITLRRSSNLWARTPIDSDISMAMAQSLQDSFKNKNGVAFQPSYAGSGPEGVFQKLFPNMEQAYSGFGPAESRIHAPDEYIVIEDYLIGIESVVRLMELYAQKKNNK